MTFGMPYLLEISSIRECVQLCHELELSFVELNANFPACQLHRMDSQELRRLTAETGVTFTLHVEEECDPFTFNPAVRKAWMKTMECALRFAADMQMPIVNMHLPHGVYITLPDKKVYLYDACREEYRSALSDFRSLCERILTGTDTRISIENTNGWKSHEREAIAYLLQSPVFGLTLDIGHSHGVKDCDEPFFRAHEEKLIHMHGHDALGQANHLALADGEIDLRARFAWARQQNARIVLETKTIEALRKSVGRLPEILAEM